MADLIRKGYGQVEPNHMSAQRTGQIYAQLPAVSTITVLENGTFAKYNYEVGVVDFVGDGEWMLVYNEVKLYDSLYQSLKDFALKKVDGTQGVITPRLFKTNVGDIFTTNMLAATATALPAVGDKLAPGVDGILVDAGVVTTGMLWNVVKSTTMPDGQPAVKLQRIQ